MTDVIVALGRDPYRLPLAREAGGLTPKQIRLLAERADSGPSAPEAVPTDREAFWTWGRRNKLKDYQIQALWNERQKAEQ